MSDRNTKSRPQAAPITTCAECRTSFTPRGPGKPQRFCSARCRYRFNNDLNRKRRRNSFAAGQNSFAIDANDAPYGGAAPDAEWRDWPPYSGDAA
jgi:hypothetical protein